MANARDDFEAILMADRVAHKTAELGKRADDPRRPRWIPDNAIEIRPEGTDLVLYPWERMGPNGQSYGLVAYMGKQGKPFANYTYGKRKNERDREMEGYIASRKQQLQRKLDERAKKKEFKTGLFFGDILYTSWGYDQTNVDFYEVTEVIGAQTVKVREIGGEVVKGDAFSEEVVPTPGRFVGPELKVRVQQGDSARIEGHHASKWDGRPVHQTGPYGGH